MRMAIKKLVETDCKRCKRVKRMKLKALSKYDGDVDTRYGDCIMLYDDTSLIVYDCGHSRRTEEV